MRRRNSIVHSHPIRKPVSNGTPLLWILAITVAVLMLAGPALGQPRLLGPAKGQTSFMVRPMRVEAAIRPGQTVTKAVELVNHSGELLILDLGLVELSQWETGTWRGIDPNSNDIDTSKQFSCREWIKLSADSVRLDPLAINTVILTIKAPPNARGFYVAAFTAKTRPKVGVTGVGIIFRFLVPILVNIQARAVRHKIGISDVGMEFRQQSEKAPATTLVSMEVANQGRTGSGLRPSVMVKYLSAGHWREITTAELREVGIIPGVTLNLKGDIVRSLPSGKYKLTGALYVDGRRVKPLEKEIDFVGDPSAIAAAADAALDLEPAIISISSVPGATRTAVLRVYNASDSPVNIRAGLLIPRVISGVAFGELNGEDLACAEWVKVVPDEFTLHPGRRQNIRIVAKTPRAEAMHANYYATVGLWARYTDGQNAGVTKALISVRNKNVQAKPALQPMKLTIATEEASEYAIVSRFGNIGNVHITPKCTARLTTAVGRTVVSILLAGKPGSMLPLEVRDFSGVLDFSKLATGTYRLDAILEYTTADGVTGRASSAIPIRVTVEGDQRIVEIVE